MSLDVTLTAKTPVPRSGTGVFVRDGRRNRELTREEVAERWPGSEVPLQEYDSTEVYDRNITHNLNRMAEEAGIYKHLWRPDEIGVTKAEQLIEPLDAGLKALVADPERFKAFNPSNGWGDCDGLVEFVGDYLEACRACPDAEVSVSR